MFSTFKERLMLGVYIFLILAIPLGANLVSQYQVIKSNASEPKTKLPLVQPTPFPTISPAKELLNSSQKKLNLISDTAMATPAPEPSSPTIATTFGPTLTLKASLEGRNKDQSTKLFIGIMEGALVNNPKFLLTFSVDLPASGEYSNLSLAGLNPGNKYIALLKGSAQIATSSAFVMSPAVTNLNGGQSVNILSGDLNDDNSVNSADYSIAQKALGSTPASANWNANADFNKDGIINTFDLSIIIKNMGKIGNTGSWTSPIPKVASPSASLSGSPPIGSPEDNPAALNFS